jgi:hypothetical protein
MYRGVASASAASGLAVQVAIYMDRCPIATCERSSRNKTEAVLGEGFTGEKKGIRI